MLGCWGSADFRPRPPWEKRGPIHSPELNHPRPAMEGCSRPASRQGARKRRYAVIEATIPGKPMGWVRPRPWETDTERHAEACYGRLKAALFHWPWFGQGGRKSPALCQPIPARKGISPWPLVRSNRKLPPARSCVPSLDPGKTNTCFPHHFSH